MIHRLPTLPRLLTAGILAASLLGGCAANKTASQVAYDLGSLTPPPSKTSVVDPGAGTSINALPLMVDPITVADVTSAPWLDSQMMYFRLSYSNDQQPRPYAASRWSMPPPQLLTQRIKARLAQSGGVVLSSTDGAINVKVLRIEADDFSQRFASAEQSDVQVALRASVFNGRILVAQKSFSQQRPAPTPDAAGGASALAATTDALIGEMAVWLATLPVKK